MLGALWKAASGVSTHAGWVDNISHNLANINTTGYKRNRTFMEELSRAQEGEEVVEPNVRGTGAAAAGTIRNEGQGALMETENPLDLAIQGEGFFRVVRPDGTFAYTRDGTFRRDGEGNLVNSQGYFLDPQVYLDPRVQGVKVEENGTIKAQDEQGEFVAGEIYLYRFSNPEKLIAEGENTFSASEESGEAVYFRPGEQGTGSIKAGHLENSNVELYKEMTDLIMAQRALQVNARSVQDADRMWGMANNLRR